MMLTVINTSCSNTFDINYRSKIFSGKLIASVCMMFSMIIIALPVTVIVSKFTRVYAKYKDKI